MQAEIILSPSRRMNRRQVPKPYLCATAGARRSQGRLAFPIS